MHVQGRGDDQPQLVDQAPLEQRLGQRDAPVHPDITAGPPLQLGDELGRPPSMTVVFAQVRPGVVDVATNFSTPLMKLANGSTRCRPERGPIVVGPAPEEHGVLGGDDAPEVLPSPRRSR